MYSLPFGHDRVWERSVIERIRAGGPAPFAVSMYDGVPQVDWGVRTGLSTGYVYHDKQGAEERALKNKEFREGLREAQESAKARKAQEAVARKARIEAERAKLAEQEAKEAARLKERAEVHAKAEREAQRWREEYERSRASTIAERLEHAQQERQIMGSKWTCTVCGGKSFIERKNPGYRITCTSCAKSAWGSHKSLWEAINR